VPAHEATTADLAHELRETVSRFIRRLRAEPGPSVPQMTVLSRLGRDGAASVSDLAAAEKMRPQSMAPIVRELEEAGLVERRPDPGDGRRVLVELTPAGAETLGETRARREDWLAETLDRVLDEDERARLRAAIELLGRVADS
jgi:DNA-binding MarR family transcriptional regulator